MANGTVHVVLSMHLKEYTAGNNEFDMRAVPTVATLVDALDGMFPGIAQRLLDDQGEVRKFVNIFVDGEDLRELEGLLTDLSGAREIVILPSVAGG